MYRLTNAIKIFQQFLSMLKIPESSLADQIIKVQKVYNSYAEMLYGYIFGITGDHEKAEGYLVKLFSDMLEEFGSGNFTEIDNWPKLLQYARHKIPVLKHETPHPSLAGLNHEQRKVFSDVYYLRKGIDTISKELNKSKDSVRKTLKEVFFLITQKSGN